DALLFGKLEYLLLDAAEQDAHLGELLAVLDRLGLVLLLLGVLLAHPARAQLVEPNGLHDPEHPAVEPCAGIPLLDAAKRSLTGRLDQIVRLGARSRQAEGETAEARQHLAQAMTKEPLRIRFHEVSL